ncbi:glycosyltransferase family 39 protein [Helicobacter sp. 23-1045]
MPYLLGLVAIILSALMLYNGHNWGGDFSQYIAQSIALVDGNIPLQVQNNTYIIKNSASGFGPYIYPWGTSLLLAPIYKIFGFNLVAFKVLFCVLYGIFIVIFYHFCRRFMSAKISAIAVLFFALNPIFLEFNNNILSDIPFMLFSFISVIYFGSLLDSANQIKTQNLANFAESTLDSAKIANRGGAE